MNKISEWIEKHNWTAYGDPDATGEKATVASMPPQFGVSSIHLSQRDWEQVISDLESDEEPNGALKELAQTYKEKVRK